MSYKSEKVRPYNKSGSKKEQVTQMFDEIAPTYDRLNGLLSLGLDSYWRKRAIKKLKAYQPQIMLDIATGTGDFAILAEKILHPKRIIGIDISEGMMEIGRKKVRQQELERIITFERQDCASLTFPENTFDAATVAFGVRNFEYIDKSFGEILRVLKPGGVFIFMELSHPEQTPMKQGYAAYSHYVIPTIGKIISTDKSAYNYLPQSIGAFPQGREMMLILKKNGFTRIRLQRFTLGVCTLYIAEKPIL